jgi:hypothetical protein
LSKPGKFSGVPPSMLVTIYSSIIHFVCYQLKLSLGRKVAQGLCVLVSPIMFDEDDDDRDEKEDLRTRFKRRLVGKMKGDQVI